MMISDGWLLGRKYRTGDIESGSDVDQSFSVRAPGEELNTLLNLFSLKPNAVDLNSVFDEKFFKQSHIGDLQ